MKKILLLLILVFSSAYSQDTIHYPKVDDFKRMYVEAGVMKPKGALSNKFDKSFNVSLWFRNKIGKNQFLDAGIEVDLLSKPRNVNYSHADSTIVFESSKSALKIGFRYSRIFPLVHGKSDFNIETNSGIGWSALYYKIPDFYDDSVSDKFDKKTNLNTLFLSQTIKFNVYDLGVFCSYYYSPYTLFTKNYESNFGSKSIALGIVCRL